MKILLLHSILLLVLGQRDATSQNVLLTEARTDLSHPGVLMNLSAHPDDEDGATLAYYRMKFGVRTYSLFFTRGEGGQNEIGSELYEDLGVIRTEETREAARLLGTEPIFLNLFDFGYSKSATETFRMWGGQQEVVRRLVFFIRKFRPDVIFTNHNTIRGHGHHQAVAVAALAAFDAAADSTMFPEQLAGMDVWQPRRLYTREFSSSETFDVSHPVQEMDQPRGRTYLEIASGALERHRSQGMDRASLMRFTRGRSLYRLTRATSQFERDTLSFFTGLDLLREAGVPMPLVESVKYVMGLSTREELTREASKVLELIEHTRHTSTDPLLTRILLDWRENIERIVLLANNLSITIMFEDSVFVPRQRVNCSLHISSPRAQLSQVRSIFLLPNEWIMNERVSSAPIIKSSFYSKDFTLVVGEAPLLTLPAAIAQYAPIELQEGVQARIACTLDGHPVTFHVSSAFQVAPRQDVHVYPKVTWLPLEKQRNGVRVEYAIRNFSPHKVAGRVSLLAPPGWKGETASFSIPFEDSSATGTLLGRPLSEFQEGAYTLKVKTDYAEEEVAVKLVDVTVDESVRLGIIKSYDTTLEETAGRLGVPYVLLSEEDLSRKPLAGFTTIVIDIRAYLVRKDLRDNNHRLLDYVRDGGNLIVMYQRDEEWKSEYAPLPLELSRRRVADENAPVVLLAPDHPLMNQPNRIVESDWSGWKQERGLYFPHNIDRGYTEVLRSNDPDEPPLSTGYLVAHSGTGSYIYTSYVWYRQMKEGHGGALRCFANMICYPSFRTSQ